VLLLLLLLLAEPPAMASTAADPQHGGGGKISRCRRHWSALCGSTPKQRNAAAVHHPLLLDDCAVRMYPDAIASIDPSSTNHTPTHQHDRQGRWF